MTLSQDTFKTYHTYNRVIHITTVNFTKVTATYNLNNRTSIAGLL